MPENMKKDINKDRDNHLHHAMDALVIASITKSLQQKITLYEKFSRYIDGKLKEKLSDITINDEEITYDNETGEVISTNYKEYLKEQLSKDNIYYNKHNIGKLKFPLPYENFVQEAEARVYEQDINTLRYELQNLRTYTTKELKNVHILTPSLAKTKATGAMHKETYYGIYEEKDKDETIRTWKTLRTPIEKVKRKDLENIQGKEGGSKDIYNALIEWFGKDETGEKALKRHEGLITKEEPQITAQQEIQTQEPKQPENNNISTNEVNNKQQNTQVNNINNNPFEKLRQKEEEPQITNEPTPITEQKQNIKVNNNQETTNNIKKVETISELNNAYDMIINPFSSENK